MEPDGGHFCGNVMILKEKLFYLFFFRMDADDSEMLILSPLSLANTPERVDKGKPFFPDRKFSASGDDCLDTLITPQGRICVAREGNHHGPAFITFHDLGLNHISNFKVFSHYRTVHSNYCCNSL